MATTELQPIPPRKRTKVLNGHSRVDHALPALKRAAVYLKECNGVKTRLADLLDAHFVSVFEWYRGKHTPSAHHLATLLTLVLNQAESEQTDFQDVLEQLESARKRIAELEAKCG